MAHDGDRAGIDDADTARVVRLLSQLDDSDFELLEPPSTVWKGIEASVASDVARQPPSLLSPPPMVVEYRIDADDVLAGVGGDWADFATDNNAAELATPEPDRTLWSYIDRDEIRELWQLVVERVRTLQVDARVPFRCDAPHARRWFEMTITPEPSGGVRFRSVLRFEEARPPVALLDPDSARDENGKPIALCSWCGRGEHDGQWWEVDELMRVGRLLERTVLPPVSYGICHPCRTEMAAELLVPAAPRRPPT